MNDRYTLVGYIATLIALVAVFIAALIASAVTPAIVGKMEVFGLGTITGGLIGVLRLPQRPAGASDATLGAALNKVPDAPSSPAPVPDVTLKPGQTAQAQPDPQ